MIFIKPILHFLSIFFVFLKPLVTINEDNNAFGLLSSLSRPAGRNPTAAAPSQPQTGTSTGATGKQLGLGSGGFGGLIDGIFNQALSNFARPSENGGVNIDLGAVGNPQNWNIFGGSTGAFQPAATQGGNFAFPGKPTSAPTQKLTTILSSTISKLNITSIADVPGW